MYTYDANGLRVGKEVNGESTQYALDYSQPHAAVALRKTSSERIRYLYGSEGEPVGEINETTGEVRFYHRNYQGSFRVSTNLLGERVGGDKFVYDGYGRILRGLNNGVEHLYTGNQQDIETGLVYLRQRYYSPELGRFISRDPYEGQVIKPITKNPYHYADNNPIFYTDPTGLFSLGEMKATLSILNTLKGIKQTWQTAKAIKWIDRARSIVFMFGVGLGLAGAGGFLLAHLGYGKELLSFLKAASSFPGIAISNNPFVPQSSPFGLPGGKPVDPLDGSAFLELKVEPPKKTKIAQKIKAAKFEVSVKLKKLVTKFAQNWKFKLGVELAPGGSSLDVSVGQNDKGQLIFGAALNSDYKFAQVPSVDPKGWIYEGAIRVGTSLTTTYTNTVGTTSGRLAVQLKNKLLNFYKLDYNLITFTGYW